MSNHYESNHWATNHWQSNHFAGAHVVEPPAPASPPIGGAYNPNWRKAVKKALEAKKPKPEKRRELRPVALAGTALLDRLECTAALSVTHGRRLGGDAEIGRPAVDARMVRARLMRGSAAISAREAVAACKVLTDKEKTGPDELMALAGIGEMEIF